MPGFCSGSSITSERANPCDNWKKEKGGFEHHAYDEIICIICHERAMLSACIKNHIYEASHSQKLWGEVRQSVVCLPHHLVLMGAPNDELVDASASLANALNARYCVPSPWAAPHEGRRPHVDGQSRRPGRARHSA